MRPLSLKCSLDQRHIKLFLKDKCTLKVASAKSGSHTALVENIQETSTNCLYARVYIPCLTADNNKAHIHQCEQHELTIIGRALNVNVWRFSGTSLRPSMSLMRSDIDHCYIPLRKRKHWVSFFAKTSALQFLKIVNVWVFWQSSCWEWAPAP